ncbi:MULTISPECIES: MFS transporter [Streptomonospora]|uniref:MFS transporter n=2 Tax=Streptomonospora TaxID=104204 RepID=A0ABV9SJX3_9ACTN
MHDSSTTGTEPAGGGRHTRWNALLAVQAAVLVTVNFMADTAIGAPLVVLSRMLDHFDTDQAAWLNASAMLAGAMWAPLLGKSADVHGKRKVLGVTLLISCAGALACAAAPNIWVFIVGRMLHGAAVAAMFLTVALVRDICASRIGMVVVGVVTSGSAVLSIADSFFVEALAAQFGFRSLFLLSAGLALGTAVCVRFLIPESRIRTPGRIDFSGALLLGGGLVMALSYISLGSQLGWFAPGPLALLGGGTAALARWFLVSSRKPEPVIDVRNLGGPLVLTLLVVVLGTGAYQSMLQLVSIVADVPAALGLGYGLADQGSLAMVLAVPAVGIMVGGPVAGALATRIGPAPALAAGVALGTVGTVGMFLGASVFAAAVFFVFLLGLAAGALVTSGFNMAGALAPADRQGGVSSLVMVMVAIGSVVLNFVGAAVLESTDVVVGGSTENSAAGVSAYIAVALGAFAAAGVLAVVVVRRRAAARAEDGASA